MLPSDQLQPPSYDGWTKPSRELPSHSHSGTLKRKAARAGTSERALGGSESGQALPPAVLQADQADLPALWGGRGHLSVSEAPLPVRQPQGTGWDMGYPGQIFSSK